MGNFLIGEMETGRVTKKLRARISLFSFLSVTLLQAAFSMELLAKESYIESISQIGKHHILLSNSSPLSTAIHCKEWLWNRDGLRSLRSAFLKAKIMDYSPKSPILHKLPKSGQKIAMLTFNLNSISSKLLHFRWNVPVLDIWSYLEPLTRKIFRTLQFFSCNSF